MNTNVISIAHDCQSWDFREHVEKSVHKDVKKKRAVDPSLWCAQLKAFDCATSPLKKSTGGPVTQISSYPS